MPDALHGRGRNPFVADHRDYSPEVLKLRIAKGISKPLPWTVPKILDQGQTPECTSFGSCGACDADDVNHVLSNLDDAFAHKLYATFGGPDGAQVRDALKALKKAGIIDAYALLKGQAAIEDWLDTAGPVVYGTVWGDGMMEADSTGRVLVSIADLHANEGHCFYGNGYDSAKMKNVQSWGEGWGIKGLFYFTQPDWTSLYGAGGEAWAITQAAVVPPAPPAPGPTPSPAPPVPPVGAWAWVKALVKWLDKYFF